MATLATVAQRSHAEEGTPPRAVPWHRMVWVTWRQHRVAIAGVLLCLGGASIYIWRTGLQLHHAYGAVLACHPRGSSVCFELTSGFNGVNNFLTNGGILQAIPALIGALVGAPVLARELETGTFRFAWTQGFGRWRWTLAKVLTLAAVVVVISGVTSLLFSWYFQPYFGSQNQALNLQQVTSLAPGLFNVRGPAFAAWTLVAFAIGCLVGLLIRRVVPAIVVTLAAYAALGVAAGAFLRQHYAAPLVSHTLSAFGSAWVLSQQWLLHGHPAGPNTINQVLLHGGPQFSGKGGGFDPYSYAAWRYLAQHGFTRLTTYQPASRFWSFQWIETSWLLALSALLIAATVWLVRRRVT